MIGEGIVRGLDRIREDLGVIVELLPIAEAIQWDAAPSSPRPREDTTERGKGGPVADPTADVVGDERRLAVRDAVRHSKSLLRAVAAAGKVKRELQHAIDAWEGVDA